MNNMSHLQDNVPVADANAGANANANAGANANAEDVKSDKDVRLVDLEINNENMALNVMVSFLNLAHKRGAFSLDESAKIWECVKVFSSQNRAV